MTVRFPLLLLAHKLGFGVLSHAAGNLYVLAQFWATIAKDSFVCQYLATKK